MKLVSTGRTISTTEYLAKKIKERRKRLYVACGVGLIILIAAVFVLRLGVLQIKDIEVSGAAATSPDSVKMVVRDLLSEKYLWLIPKENALLYPHTTLENLMLRKFPRLNAVSTSLEGAHLLHVTVSERKPFALYCSDLCYFLDETGFIFDFSPTFSNGVYFTYTSSEPVENPVGNPFLPQAEFEALTGFISGLKNLGLEPSSLALSKTEGRVDTALGAKILFSRSAEIGGTFSTLESFLKTPVAQEDGFLKKVDTLDMRTENKVFYSFR